MLFRKLTQKKNTPQAPPKYPPQVELLIQKMGDSYMTMREMAEVCNIKFPRKLYHACTG